MRFQYNYNQTLLRMMKPEHEFFVVIDSDGCVFELLEEFIKTLPEM